RPGVAGGRARARGAVQRAARERAPSARRLGDAGRPARGGRLMRLLRARDPDLMLALLFLAASLVERIVAPEGEGSPAAEVLGALIMSVPLYWLRRHPLPVLLVLLPAGFVNQLIATDTDEMF